MAHTCPDCGDTCYCRGDIDDMVMDGGPEERGCAHGCTDAMDDDDWEPEELREGDLDQ